MKNALKARFRSLLSRIILRHYLHVGSVARLQIAATAVVNNALFNLYSGEIRVGEYAFFGYNVCLLTGTHDYTRVGKARQDAVPRQGRDIIIGEGAWIGSNVTIIGPCRVGANAVIAAGSVVTRDVEANTIFAGVPAKFVKSIADQVRSPH